jgi:V8-like Glu-specific endopeptidase
VLLTVDDIYAIHQQALKLGLQNKRDLLLFGVNIEYVAGLPDLTTPADQLLSDLQNMNDDGAVAGGVPLERWLRNAAYATSPRPDKQQFFREYADKAAKAAQFGAAMAPPPAVHPERILFESDLLPFGFLAGALRTGRSVARLSVPRMEDGQPRLLTSGNPTLFFGTGWLIGAKHVITNHHVINARTDGEAPASAGDFELQAKGVVVQFDYDVDQAEGERLEIAALTASDARLDYALLELTAPPAQRKPLPLWARPIDLSGGTRLPVNIIQHPGGHPKQIAIRNNLAAALEAGELRYFTDTAEGSSGSPVCNDQWQVLALHRASTMSYGKYNYQGKDTAWINIGTTMTHIVEDLRAKSKWDGLGAVMV